MSSSRVSIKSATLAVGALLKWMKKNPSAGDDFIHLIFTLKKSPKTPLTFRLPLPHPLHAPSSVCLFLENRSLAAAEKIIQPLDLPIQLIPLSSLRTDFQTFDSRKRLADAHSLFLADRKLIPLLPNFLGKPFFKKKRAPVAVDLRKENWPDQVRECCGSTFMCLKLGTCSGVKVGRGSMGKEEIVENLMAAVEGAVGNVPRKWRNVRSLHVKATESLALPVYQVVPEVGVKVDGLGTSGVVEDGLKKRKGEVSRSEGTEVKRTKRHRIEA